MNISIYASLSFKMFGVLFRIRENIDSIRERLVAVDGEMQQLDEDKLEQNLSEDLTPKIAQIQVKVFLIYSKNLFNLHLN